MKIFLPLFALALASCGSTVTVERPVITYVPIKAPCPSVEEANRLKQTRPKPLRAQPMPGSAVERTAQQSAQLGRYEAEGGWGDQVITSLDRCQAK